MFALLIAAFIISNEKLCTSVKATSSVTLQRRKFIWQTNV